MSITRLLDGDDKAREEGFPNFRVRMQRMNANGFQWRGEEGIEHPVSAIVDYGRWLANCECGGAEYVTPTYPHFFCFSCGNRITNGASRPVVFPSPAERQQIELVLMERPMNEPIGLPETQTCLHARPLFSTGLLRNWRPGQTIVHLRLENALHSVGGA